MHLVPMDVQEGVRSGCYGLQPMGQENTLQQPRGEESWAMLHQAQRGVLY